MKKPLFILLSLFLISFQPLISQYYGSEEEVTKPFSIGIKAGSAALWGEVEPDPTKSYEAGLTLQQVLSRVVDFRVQFHHGQARGLDKEPGVGLKNNDAWNGDTLNLSAPNYDSTLATPFLNNQTRYFDGTIQLKVNLNRIFLKDAESWDFYVFGGVGVFMFQTHVDALDASGEEYDFSEIPVNTDQTASSLRNLLDGNFETRAEQNFFSNSKVGNYALLTTWGGGAGVRFRLGESLALGLEGRYLDTNEYLTDGVQWNAENRSTGRTDKLLSAALTVEIVLKKKSGF